MRTYALPSMPQVEAELLRRGLKYSDDQPRVPAGSPDGGQFGPGGGGGGGIAEPSATLAEHRADRAYSKDAALANLRKLPQFEPGPQATDDPDGAQFMRDEYRMNGLPIVGQPVTTGGYTDRTEAVEAAFHSLDWNASMSIEDVRTDSLVTYQRYLQPKVFTYANEMDAGSKNPVAIVMQYHGQNWVMDGNHRVNALMAGGTKVVRVQFLNADEKRS